MTGFAIGFLSLSLKKESGEVVTCVAWLVALKLILVLRGRRLDERAAERRREFGGGCE